MARARVALIACTNGHGHVRRMMALAGALTRREGSPVLFAPRQSVERLSAATRVPIPETVDFDSGTRIADWLGGRAIDWVNRMPDLGEFVRVVSDNLVEILEIRPDAWLSGSFFWHRALQEFPEDLARRAEHLLERHRPPMISTDLYTPDYLQELARVHRVGLFRLGTHFRAPDRADALIACGLGGGAGEAARNLVGAIAKKPSLFPTVWIEPALLPQNHPSWMRCADFSPSMYARLLVAVIRPGVGTATDALLAGARIFSFHESGNLEMASNAKKIAASGLGVDAGDPFAAWVAALALLRQPQSHSRSCCRKRISCRYGYCRARRQWRERLKSSRQVARSLGRMSMTTRLSTACRCGILGPI